MHLSPLPAGCIITSWNLTGVPQECCRKKQGINNPKQQSNVVNMLRTQTWLGLFTAAALAYAGSVEEPRARVQRLEKAVLAPCCYKETVGKHQSEIAVQLRVEIAKWVEQGKTDAEILNTYASRYGAKVLVDPNTIPKSWTLIVPWVLTGFGMLGATCLLWRWRATRLATPAPSDTAGAMLPEIPDLDD